MDCEGARYLRSNERIATVADVQMLSGSVEAYYPFEFEKE